MFQAALMPQHIAELCNGSTYDSDSYCLGSNPSSAANHTPPWSSGLGRRPLTAVTGVRIPLEVPLKESLLSIKAREFFLIPAQYNLFENKKLSGF